MGLLRVFLRSLAPFLMQALAREVRAPPFSPKPMLSVHEARQGLFTHHQCCLTHWFSPAHNCQPIHMTFQLFLQRNSTGRQQLTTKLGIARSLCSRGGTIKFTSNIATSTRKDITFTRDRHMARIYACAIFWELTGPWGSSDLKLCLCVCVFSFFF